MIQLGSALYTPSILTPDLGGVDLFSGGRWYREFVRPASDFPIDERSDAILGAFTNEWGISLDFAASTQAGGNSAYSTPVCVVGADCPRFDIFQDWLAYGSESDAGPYPIPPEVQKFYPYSTRSDGDSDLIVVVTNPDQSNVTDIYEYYNIYYIDNLAETSKLDLKMVELPPRYGQVNAYHLISLARSGDDIRVRFADVFNVPRRDTTGSAYVASLTADQQANARAKIADLIAALDPLWGAESIPADQQLAVLRQVVAAFGFQFYAGSGIARFDLASGLPRTESWTSASAGGMSKFLGLVRYDEVERGRIPHAIRLCIDAGNTSNKFVYPGRHAVGGWNPSLGLPMGARLSVRPDWYEANQAKFPGQDGVILRALLEFGGIVDDIETGGSFGIVALTGIGDDRWHQDELLNVRNIPRSAFRVHKLEPGYSIEAPNRVKLGESFQVTFRAQPPDKERFGGNLYYTWNAGQTAVFLSDKQTAATATLDAKYVGVQELIQQPYPDWYHAPPVMIEVVDGDVVPPPPPPPPPPPDIHRDRPMAAVPPWRLPRGRIGLSRYPGRS